MFDHGRKLPWFAEKYDTAPEFQAMRTRVRKSGCKGRMDAFILYFNPDERACTRPYEELEVSSPSYAVPHP